MSRYVKSPCRQPLACHLAGCSSCTTHERVFLGPHILRSLGHTPLATRPHQREPARLRPRPAPGPKPAEAQRCTPAKPQGAHLGVAPTRVRGPSSQRGIPSAPVAEPGGRSLGAQRPARGTALAPARSLLPGPRAPARASRSRGCVVYLPAQQKLTQPASPQPPSRLSRLRRLLCPSHPLRRAGRPTPPRPRSHSHGQALAGRAAAPGGRGCQ